VLGPLIFVGKDGKKKKGEGSSSSPKTRDLIPKYSEKTLLNFLSQDVNVTARHTRKNGEGSKSVDCSMNEKTKLERGERERERVAV